MPPPANTTSPACEESSALFLQREMQDILKTETGLHEEFATPIAVALVRGWRKRAGAQRIYIPAEYSKNTTSADRACIKSLEKQHDHSPPVLP